MPLLYSAISCCRHGSEPLNTDFWLLFGKNPDTEQPDGVAVEPPDAREHLVTRPTDWRSRSKCPRAFGSSPEQEFVRGELRVPGAIKRSRTLGDFRGRGRQEAE